LLQKPEGEHISGRKKGLAVLTLMRSKDETGGHGNIELPSNSGLGSEKKVKQANFMLSSRFIPVRISSFFSLRQNCIISFACGIQKKKSHT
jgi:hypothetical protein